jgi:hypothetical protein
MLLLLSIFGASLVSAASSVTRNHCLDAKQVSIVFEGFPAANTPLLQTCREKRLTAAFFPEPAAHNEPQTQARIKEAIKDGHVIGYRTNPRKDATIFNVQPEVLAKDIAVAGQVYQTLYGQPLKYIMLPFTETDHSHHTRAIERAGFVVVGRNIDLNANEMPTNLVSVLKEKIVEPGTASYIVLQSAYHKQADQLVQTVATVALEQQFAVVSLGKCLPHERLVTVPPKANPVLQPFGLLAAKPPTGGERERVEPQRAPATPEPIPVAVSAPPKPEQPASDATSGRWSPALFLFIAVVLVLIVAAACYCFATAGSDDSL